LGEPVRSYDGAKPRSRRRTKRAPGTSVVGRVMLRLRQEALATPPGQLIGPEDQLMASYSVSRGTLRKAAAMVREEQLIHVRRGMGGGYFARRPAVDAVARIAAIYLRSKHTTLDEIVGAIEPLQCEMTLLAAQNRDPRLLETWREFHTRDLKATANSEYHEFLESEREFRQLLGAASRNIVLELFVAILYDFCSFLLPSENIFRDRTDRVQEYWSLRQLQVASIIEADFELASITARRCSQLLAAWAADHFDASKAEQIAPLHIKARTKVSNTVSRLVLSLREASLWTAPGELIGSEDHLVAMYKVSRPTLRQAAALVGQEQLLAVRRGTGGGYFARRPETDAVAHMAAIYLQSRNTTMAEVIKAVEPLRVEMAMLAAKSRTPDELKELKAFFEHDSRLFEVGGADEYGQSERALAQLVGRACHNSVLLLFITCLHQFSFSRNDRLFYDGHQERVRMAWAARQKILVAIIEGDEEIAGILARRFARMHTEWLIDDVEHDGFLDDRPLARSIA